MAEKKRSDLFAGKAALVTGGGKRVGRAIALRLGAEGADVIVNYNTSRDGADEVVSDIKGMGVRAVALQADVSRRASVEKLFEQGSREFGRLDILVNNVGIFLPAKFEDLTDEQWDNTLNTNLKSQFLCSQAAAPIMKRHGGGHIVNITSLGGFLVWPSYMPYNVSKAGAIMLTKCLARALGPEILVNSVAPGTIGFPGEEFKDYVDMVPLHRLGTGDDIGDAVVYLASSKFVTGQTIAVDGGRLLV